MFCSRPSRTAKAEQKNLLYRNDKPNEPTKESPFHMLYFLSPSSLQFQQSAVSLQRTKRQATQHGCLPSLLGDGDRGIAIVHGKEKDILSWADYSSQG